MKKIHCLLLLTTFFFSTFRVHATALISVEESYGVSLTSELSSSSSSLSINRNEVLYLIGPFVNNTDKTQSIRFGVELKEVSTGERYYKTLSNEKEWADGLRLVHISFTANFIIRNGSYEVRAVYMDLSKDANDASNWEYVSIPVGLTIPQINVVGEEPVAYFTSLPCIGNQRNVTTLSDTKFYFSLSALSTIEKGELYAFVYESGGSLSIGYFKLSFLQNKGETKEYTAEYKKSGSQAADLVAGKTYELSFNLFDDRKEKFFDLRYEGMKFSVIEDGAGILDTIYNGDESGRVCMGSGRKLMLQDGTIIIEHSDRKYGVLGSEIK